MISLKTNSGIYGINKSFSTQYYDNSLQFRQIHCLNSDFDNLFLLPKCAFASHKKIYLRRDLARYNFNINIVADTPKGNVWISGNKETTNMQQQCRPGSANKGGEHYQVQRDREERIKQLKEKQNEERQRKLEELKAQALATQKLREQKEEERRRRIDDLKSRDNDKRQQVEERKKAIWEAEKERREYILRKNQERDQRLETKKKNERSQIAFAFGSSTPRMLDSECGSIWAYRRANSIQNVCTNTSISPVTRRSSERELNEGSKKRATSASGLDRQSEAQKRMSSSMHEVFHWGPNTSGPKKLSLSVAGSQIDFEGPPSSSKQSAAARYSARNRHSMVMVDNSQDDSYDSRNGFSVHRRKTDLMPTIPSPRDRDLYRSSVGTHTPRTPGRAFSMTRLDQLSKPFRRNGEHICAILERERRKALDLENLSKASLTQSSPGSDKRMSRSMSQLSGRVRSRDNSRTRQNRLASSPLQRHIKNTETTRSMTQLTGNNAKKSSSTSVTPTKSGLRSGEMTPKSISNSRPGSAMSSSTTNSAIVNKRTTPVRKARPVSIAVTGVSKDEKSPAPLAPSSASKPIKRTPSAAKSTPAPETPKTKPTSSAKATPKSSTTPSIMSPATEVAPKIIQQQTVTITQEIVVPANDESKNEKTIINNVIKAEQIHTEMSFVDGQEQSDETPTNDVKTTVEVAQEVVDSVIEKIETQENHIETVEVKPEMQESTPIVPQVTQAPPQPQQLLTDSILENTDMTASMIAKTKITTEEEAKAAIAERRRLAREEAERQAEIERKRIEAEEEAERKRQLEEEERHRLMEQEANKLAEEQRRLEEERLQQAIEENKKREEEEQKRKAEEAKQKIEREQAEQRSREEAERAKIETAERLKKEEKEREERRKRVEAIMARTRKGAANTPSKNDESMDLSKSQIELSQSMTENTTAPSTNNESEQSDNNKMDVAKEDEVKEPEKPNQPPQNDYEKSVTEKENLLMSSFNKMNLNSNGLNNNLLETNNNLNLLNGQHVKDTSSDLIISDANIIETTNGHDKNSIENTFNSSELTTTTTEQSSSKPIEDKLIDFGTDAAITNSDQMSTNLNNNNFLDSNSSLITHNLNNNNTNNNNLVAASDMNDERDLSLL
ncbi:MAP7 domain-containing protein 1 isoform X3 [Chironomus tepperi]|uniref:MAP7 domain-containing protein 1 isoform X3 n=1 Tax=Chironomus tepperi TaxID=113505 RepID=UPI00391F9FB4